MDHIRRTYTQVDNVPWRMDGETIAVFYGVYGSMGNGWAQEQKRKQKPQRNFKSGRVACPYREDRLKYWHSSQMKLKMNATWYKTLSANLSTFGALLLVSRSSEDRYETEFANAYARICLYTQTGRQQSNSQAD